jgi:hypothetical protein
MLVFSIQLCELLSPLTFSLVNFPPPPFPVQISILYTSVQRVRGGGLGGTATKRSIT